jgi:hypothetical protein
MSYLILHKVRGEPVFDIADRLRCPVCEPMRQGLDHGQDYAGNCTSCDDGYWWIIPTSGHRAYPYVEWPLDSILPAGATDPDNLEYAIPPDWPDHYPMDAGEAPKSNFNIMTIISPMMSKFKRRL